MKFAIILTGILILTGVSNQRAYSQEATKSKTSVNESSTVLHPTPSKVAALFAKFRGKWQCRGALTKNNKPIESTITFTPVLNGKALQYEQNDIPPNKFHSLGLWALDAASKSLIYITLSTVTNRNQTAAALLVGKISGDSLITFTADTLVAPPYTTYRYRYEITGDHQFKYQWQLYKDGVWETGDYLKCKQDQ